MDKRKRGQRFYLLGVVFVILVCLLLGRGWPARPVAAFDQPADAPGSAADPVLTVNSLRQQLDQLFAVQTRQLDELQARLDRVARELPAVQAAGVAFPDLNGHWAAGAVLLLKARGIVGGYPDGNFHPDDRVTRAALAVMLAKAKNLAPSAGTAGFSDLPPQHWAAGAIGAARAAGYMQGYPDGRFRPDRGVTRAEAAVVLNKAFALQISDSTARFSDLGGHWAADAIRRLAAAGVLNGYPDGTFRPDKTMNRAEGAAVLARVLPQQ